MPWYLGNSQSFGEWNGMELWGMRLLAPLILWSVIWTGLALWHSARRREKWWFIFFLLVHTIGIAEIIYLVFVVKIFHSSKKRSK